MKPTSLKLTKIIFTKVVSSAIILMALTACGGRKSSADRPLIVSISPLKYVVESITGNDFDIRVMVPDGASPETYSPTSQQIIDIENAEMVFATGLIDFETELTKKISNTLNSNNIINVSKNVTLIEGDSHVHNNHTHSGPDPHIWTSPEQLKVISRNVYDAIIAQYPDSVKYTESYNKLTAKLDSISTEIRTKISDGNRKYFVIYHPALSYYARDYGIEQISLEDEGKEPSAIHLREIAAQGRKDKIKYILYQRQFSTATVESLAADTGATPVAIDPLAEDIVGQILYITDVITQ